MHRRLFRNILDYNLKVFRIKGLSHVFMSDEGELWANLTKNEVLDLYEGEVPPNGDDDWFESNTSYMVVLCKNNDAVAGYGFYEDRCPELPDIESKTFTGYIKEYNDFDTMLYDQDFNYRATRNDIYNGSGFIACAENLLITELKRTYHNIDVNKIRIEYPG